MAKLYTSTKSLEKQERGPSPKSSRSVIHKESLVNRTLGGSLSYEQTRSDKTDETEVPLCSTSQRSSRSTGTASTQSTQSHYSVKGSASFSSQQLPISHFRDHF